MTILEFTDDCASCIEAKAAPGDMFCKDCRAKHEAHRRESHAACVEVFERGRRHGRILRWAVIVLSVLLVAASLASCTARPVVVEADVTLDACELRIITPTVEEIDSLSDATIGQIYAHNLALCALCPAKPRCQ